VLCLVAAFAISAIAVASASAAAPEFGRCIKKATKGGEGYSNGVCTDGVSTNAKYEWQPGPGEHNKFISVEREVFPIKYDYCSSGITHTRVAEKDEKEAKAAEALAEKEEKEAREAEARAEKEEKEAKEAEEEGNLTRAKELSEEAKENRNTAKKLSEEAKENRTKAKKLSEEAEENRNAATKELAKAKMTLHECEIYVETTRALAPAELETVGGSTVICGEVASKGEYTGPKTVGNLVTTFGQCEITEDGILLKCTSAGAAEEGEISTSTLDGKLGVVKKVEEHGEVTVLKEGIALFPASGEVVAEFSCDGSLGPYKISVPVKVTGSVVHDVEGNKMVSTEVEKFTQTKGKQNPEAFQEPSETDVLETSVSGGADEQSGMKLRTTLENEEPIEVNKDV